MDDLNDKIKERWQQRRKKSYNWTKLVIMFVVLVAILWAIGKMNNSVDKINWATTPERVQPVDSTSVPAGTTP